LSLKALKINCKFLNICYIRARPCSLKNNFLFELEKLKQTPLKTQLVSGFEEKPIGKEVTLSYGETTGPDGFDFKILKKGKEYTWKSITGYDVKINQWVIDHILRQGHFGTRYDGENKIAIYVKSLF